MGFKIGLPPAKGVAVANTFGYGIDARNFGVLHFTQRTTTLNFPPGVFLSRVSINDPSNPVTLVECQDEDGATTFFDLDLSTGYGTILCDIYFPTAVKIKFTNLSGTAFGSAHWYRHLLPSS
ncbi:MAG TPA: hypothetical protein PKE63_07865 [Lacibacter sp.]|nr:hypothetical protein [Lacibacter sp.]HMO89570.1 hypothetical protein [Lacibacter sp.]HMP87181.1 hypothetical protein [Lacibacter sp.]